MSQINSCCGQGSNIPNVNVYLPNTPANNQQQTGIQLRINNNDNKACQGNSCGNQFSFDAGNKSSSAAINPFGNKNDASGIKNNLGTTEKQVNDFIKTITDALRTDKTGGQEKKVLGDFSQKDLEALRTTGLKPDGKGGATIPAELKPILSKVAQYMDNDTKYPKPDSGSWVNEVREDNALNMMEATNFQDAMTRILGQADKQGITGKFSQQDTEQMRQGLFTVDPRNGTSTFDVQDRDLLSKIAVKIDADNAAKNPSIFQMGSLNSAIQSGNSLSKEQTEQLTKAIGEHLSKATNNQTVDKLTSGTTTGSTKTDNNCANNASSCATPSTTKSSQAQGSNAKGPDKAAMEQFKVLLAAIFQLFMSLFEGNQKKV